MKVAVNVHGKVKTLDDEVVINTRGRTPLSKAELKSLGPQGVGLQVRLGSDVGTLKQNYVKVCHLVTHSHIDFFTYFFIHLLRHLQSYQFQRQGSIMVVQALEH